MQEASRVVRKLYESARWRAHFGSGGRLSPPRLGWVNFEFLRGSPVLGTILDDLRLDIWDREALSRRVQEATNPGGRSPLHPIYDMVNKIYTVDLVLRAA